jgi:hypothetical protein
VSELRAGGWELCRKAGIAAMDGEMLAAYLADKEVGMIEADGQKKFNENAFLDWLQS